jgi:hypothetical protein
MSSYDYRAAADRVFHMAHRFLYEYKVKWLPVDIIGIAQSNWNFKWVHDLAWETDKTPDYICRHVCQSFDGVTQHKAGRDSYDIILNDLETADGERNKRVYWNCGHEVGHIYLGHLESEGVPSITKGKIDPVRYNQLEYEADLFAGEVLASKWLMRDIGVSDESDIALLCGISDPAALSRYRRVTAQYSFEPMNAVVTRQNFGEYLKEITVCRKIDGFAETDIGDVSRFAWLNKPRMLLPTPKPSFLRRPGNCPYCDSVFEADDNPNFCIYCGKPLKKGLTPAAEPCGKINPKEAAYCSECGNRVYRIRQGFCFSECEI